jgi:hypothetical protein
MKKVFFFLSVVAALVFAITNCGDGVGVADGKGDVPDTSQGSNPLVGKWYEVGSTNTVVFTNTTVTGVHYEPFFEEHLIYYQENEPYLDIRVYDSIMELTYYNDVVYDVFPDNQIRLTHWMFPDDGYITRFTFIGDTLEIAEFVPPFRSLIPVMRWIYLVRGDRNEK